MGKLLKFAKPPSTLRVDSLKENPGNVPREPLIKVEEVITTDVIKQLRDLFTDSQVEEIRKDLENED